MGKYGIMLALCHTKERLLFPEFQLERLFGKSSARPVAAGLDFKREGVGSRANCFCLAATEKSAAVGVEPVFSLGKVIFVIEVFGNNLVIIGKMLRSIVYIDIKNRERARQAFNRHILSIYLISDRNRCGVLNIFKRYRHIVCGLGHEVSAALQCIKCLRLAKSVCIRFGHRCAIVERLEIVGADFEFARQAVYMERIILPVALKAERFRTPPRNFTDIAATQIDNRHSIRVDVVERKSTCSG